MSLEEKRKRYLELCHAMQTGVAFKIEKNNSEATPKHLRVGVNVAMSDHSALVNLLIKKGVITEDEYYEAMIAAMESEVERYSAEINQLYGSGIGITLV